jgi:hypothetical protein
VNEVSPPQVGRIARVLAVAAVVVLTWFVEKGFKALIGLF